MKRMGDEKHEDQGQQECTNRANSLHNNDAPTSTADANMQMATYNKPQQPQENAGTQTMMTLNAVTKTTA